MMAATRPGSIERGRAAAEEDGADGARADFISGAVDLGQVGGLPVGLVNCGSDMAVEVAIGAFGFAERPVDVDTEAAVSASLRRPFVSRETSCQQGGDGFGAVADGVFLRQGHFCESLSQPIGLEHRVVAVAIGAATGPDELAGGDAFEDFLMAVGPIEQERAAELGGARVAGR